MRPTWVALLSLPILVVGCATSVDPGGGTYVGDTGFSSGDSSHDTSVVTDAGGDTTSSSKDTGTTAIDSGTVKDTSPGVDTATEIDSFVEEDTGIVEDTDPPPTDAPVGTCTVDTDCSAPFNCCDTTSGTCSILFIFICLPAS